MELNITSKQENPLLNREEIRFEIKKAKITPSRKEVKGKIAAMCNAETELVVIDEIRHSFGKHYVTGNAKIYKNKESMDMIEAKYVLNRNLGIKKKDGEANEEKSAKPAEEPGGESGEKKDGKPDAGAGKAVEEKPGEAARKEGKDSGKEDNKDKAVKEGE